MVVGAVVAAHLALVAEARGDSKAEVATVREANLVEQMAVGWVMEAQRAVGAGALVA